MLLKFQQVVFWNNKLFYLSSFNKLKFRNNRLFYLSSFLKGFEKLDFAVKSIQPIASTKQLIVFLKTLTEFC